MGIALWFFEIFLKFYLIDRLFQGQVKWETKIKVSYVQNFFPRIFNRPSHFELKFAKEDANCRLLQRSGQAFHSPPKHMSLMGWSFFLTCQNKGVISNPSWEGIVKNLWKINSYLTRFLEKKFMTFWKKWYLFPWKSVLYGKNVYICSNMTQNFTF